MKPFSKACRPPSSSPTQTPRSPPLTSCTPSPRTCHSRRAAVAAGPPDCWTCQQFCAAKGSRSISSTSLPSSTAVQFVRLRRARAERRRALPAQHTCCTAAAVRAAEHGGEQAQHLVLILNIWTRSHKVSDLRWPLSLTPPLPSVAAANPKERAKVLRDPPGDCRGGRLPGIPHEQAGPAHCSVAIRLSFPSACWAPRLKHLGPFAHPLSVGELETRHREHTPFLLGILPPCFRSRAIPNAAIVPLILPASNAAIYASWPSTSCRWFPVYGDRGLPLRREIRIRALELFASVSSSQEPAVGFQRDACRGEEEDSLIRRSRPTAPFSAFVPFVCR